MTTGQSIRVLVTVGLLASLTATGCVDRRFVIESNVPNAQVFLDNRPIGAAPAHTPFEYYGYYTVTLVQPNYETLTQRVHVTAPWYAYPPFDFLAEVIWPFHIRDTRRYYFHMHEATKTRVDDLLNNADALRQRGQTLPPPERPAIPRGQPAPVPIDALPPGAVPSGSLQPSVIPSVLPNGN